MTAPLKPGDSVSFWISTSLATGLGWADSMKPLIVKRGDTVVLTSGILEAAKDLNGQSIFDYVDDEAGQVERFGRRMISRSWPSDEPVWLPNSPEERIAHEAALKAAAEITDPVARRDEMAKIRRQFGQYKSSYSLAQYAGDVPDNGIRPQLGVL